MNDELDLLRQEFEPRLEAYMADWERSLRAGLGQGSDDNVRPAEVKEPEA